MFGRGNIQTHEISIVLNIYSVQVYSRFDIVNSTVTFPVHFHTDFWSRNVTFFPVQVVRLSFDNTHMLINYLSDRHAHQ